MNNGRNNPTNETAKIAFIGPSEIHRALNELSPDWDFQVPFETINDFYDELDKEPELTSLDPATSIVLIFSRLISDPEEFAKAVASISQSALMAILVPPAEKAAVESTLDSYLPKAYDEFAKDYPEISRNAPYYFVSYNSPKQDLIKALKEFVQNPEVDDEMKGMAKIALDPFYSTSSVSSAPEPSKQKLDFLEEEDDWDFEEDGNNDQNSTEDNGKGYVIAVTSSKGGSGKSTMSILLGSYIQRAGITAFDEGLTNRDAPLKVCIVDLDVRDGQLGFLNAAPKPNVIDILQNAEDLDSLSEEAIKKGVFHSKHNLCDFIFASTRPRNYSQIPETFYYLLIEKLKTMYDVIILDTSVNYLDPLLERCAYPLADKILFVTDMGVSSVFGLVRWLKETTGPSEQGGSGIDRNKINIVVNKVIPEVNMNADKLEKAAGDRPILAAIPSMPTKITYHANTNSLEEVLDDENIKDSFESLSSALLEDTDIKLKRF